MKQNYTVEVYKRDGRTKSGERFFKKFDVTVTSPRAAVLAHYQSEFSHARGYARVELHETWVTRKNLLSGQEFQERYDTPVYCSPSSESFWSS
jgi:hypothetical protein